MIIGDQESWVAAAQLFGQLLIHELDEETRAQLEAVGYLGGDEDEEADGE